MERHSFQHNPVVYSEGRRLASPFGEPPHAQPNGQGVKETLREALQILRRGKWTILLVALVVLGGVAAYTYMVDPVYESYTVLMIESQQPDDDALSSGTIDALGRETRNLTNQALLLQQSLLIAERTVRRLQRAQDSLDAGTLTVLAEGQQAASVTDVARRLQGGYVSSRLEDREKGDALRVTATSTNPREAALIAHTYAAEYVQRVRETSRRRIVSARVFLEKQLDEREDELRTLENQMQQYMTSERAGALDEETSRTVEQVAQLEARLDEASVEEQRSRASLQSLQQELEELRPRLAARVASGAQQDIEQTQDRINELEARLEQIYIRNPELRARPSQNPDVADLQNQIAELKERARRLSEEYVDEMLAVGGTNPLSTSGNSNMTYVAQLKRQVAEERVALTGAQAQQQALRQRIGQYEQRLQNIPEQSIELARLQRAQTNAEELYVSLNQKLQEVRMAEEAKIGMAEVIRPALVPGQPVRPNPTRNLLLGLILGGALGIAAAVVRYKLDARIYTPEDLRRHHFAALGVVPDMHRIRHQAPRRLAEANGHANGPGDERTPGTALAAPQSASSAITEAYRRLHMSILYHRPGAKVQTVLVTSPEPGTGKSTTTLNLAVTAARAGQRTLVVDADLRKPQIYNLLGRSSGPFLTDLLEEPAMDPERLATDLDNVYAVTIREPLADADMVLSSDKMTRLIEHLRGTFDLILFDSPPVLAVADAVFLSRQCDATIVVAGAGQTDADALEQTAEELESAEAQVIGTVLNRFDPSAASSYKYRYEDYGYGGASGD